MPTHAPFLAALGLVFLVLFHPFPVIAQENPTFFTAAGGLVELGSATPVWHAAEVELGEGDPLDDPAIGAPGFLLVVEGSILIENGLTGHRTIVQPNGAHFLAADDSAVFTALEDDAIAWRFAVVPDGADDPIARADGVGRPVSAVGRGDEQANDGAVRIVELRVAGLFDGEEAEVGADSESIPIACALVNRVTPGDGDSIREGRCRAAPEPDAEGPLLLFADDGDAIIAVLVVGPALDPDNLSSELEEDEPEEEAPAPTPTPVPVDTGSDNTGSSNDPNTGNDNDAGNDDNGGNDGGDGGDGGGNDDGNDGGDDGGDGGGENDDVDGDGVSDQFEIENGMNPNSPDTDGDGLTDRQEAIELNLNTDPTNPDSDDDFLSDGEEFTAGSNPNMTDTDGDNLSDATEVANGCSPLTSDTDADGLPDYIVGEGCA